jgi:protein gp37
MRMAARLQAMGQAKYSGTTRKSGGRPKWTGVVRLDEGSLALPLRWREGRLIFVNSMSDLFHDAVPFDFIERVFAVMRATPRHTYQVLTKRSERLREVGDRLDWPANVWMGVSVENEEVAGRIEDLRRVPARLRFLSLEPLLGPLPRLDLDGIDWVIVGGESGPGARPIEAPWVEDIRDRCVAAGVAFHFKQWGGTNKKAAGRLLGGRIWNEFPGEAQVPSAMSAR